MGLTVAIERKVPEGNRIAVYGTITFDSSYPTGGEAITAAQVGLVSIDELAVEPSITGHVFPFNKSGLKVLAFNGTTQIANAVDLSAQAPRFKALGIGT